MINKNPKPHTLRHDTKNQRIESSLICISLLINRPPIMDWRFLSSLTSQMHERGDENTHVCVRREKTDPFYL